MLRHTKKKLFFKNNCGNKNQDDPSLPRECPDSFTVVNAGGNGIECLRLREAKYFFQKMIFFLLYKSCWRKWHRAPASARGPDMSQICPDMSQICPEMSLMCPNMSHMCPDMSQICPDMSQICPNMPHMCPNMPHML